MSMSNNDSTTRILHKIYLKITNSQSQFDQTLNQNNYNDKIILKKLHQCHKLIFVEPH